MTSNRIASMQVIDKEESLKFLYDKASGNYVVFNHYNLSTHYTNDYYVAARFFEKCITLIYL